MHPSLFTRILAAHVWCEVWWETRPVNMNDELLSAILFRLRRNEELIDLPCWNDISFLFQGRSNHEDIQRVVRHRLESEAKRRGLITERSQHAC